jgi:hypothetical protein
MVAFTGAELNRISFGDETSRRDASLRLMPFSRRLPRLGRTDRIAARLTTAQRDIILASLQIPSALGHALHRATVRAGKLHVRVDRDELEIMIRSVAAAPVTDRAADRSVQALLGYLESLEDRFADDRSDDLTEAGESTREPEQS